jgi:tetratricopeptide (TPR) repeat protein
MERVEKTIFLSYRRTNVPWALAIFQNLTHHGFDVFFDFTGIASGSFEQAILGNITAWLRREIETALDTKRNIIPLMLEGFDFGTPKIATQLTAKLAALKQYNGLSIPPEYFMEAMEKLRNKFLNVPLTAVLHPASPPAQQVAIEQKAQADAAPSVQEEALTAQQWFERGYTATDPDEKLRFYGEAIRLKPDYAEAFNNRGAARHAKGDLDGAMLDLDEAIRLMPDHAKAFNNRGVVRRTKGDLNGALQDYKEAIYLEPDYAAAFSNRGAALHFKGDLDGAVEAYSEAIRLKPEMAEAFYNRGLSRRDRGDIEGSQQDNNEALRLGYKPKK